LRYVEERQIRVFGRYEWLYEPKWRNSQRWPETSWDQEIDGKIRSICDEDSGKPKNERRVVVVPPEQGYDFADAYLDKYPEEVARWQRILVNKKSRQAIPGGTREAALRDVDEPALAARRILRDAYNHGQAIAYSEANAPLIVQHTHTQFLRILADAPPLRDEADASSVVTMRESQQVSKPTDLQLSIVTAQLLEILAELDIHARDRGEVDSLDRFIRGQGRRDLMRWLEGICALLKQTQARELNRLLLNQLRSDLKDSRFSNIMEGIAHKKDEATLAVVGMASTVLGLATDPASLAALNSAGVATLMGLTASAYPVGKGLMRQLGYAPAEFTGPQWPFLYTYGTRARRRQLKQLRYVLDELHRRQISLATNSEDAQIAAASDPTSLTGRMIINPKVAIWVAVHSRSGQFTEVRA
jgi:hypothetical protein